MNLDAVIVIKFLIVPMKNKDDTYFMREALKLAEKAAAENEVPVGCVIVYQGKIIARSYNKRKQNNDVLGHAEILAIKKASKKLNTWILDEATMYITLEPCLMCSGAIIQSRIKKVVYAAKEPKFGCAESIINVFNVDKFNHHPEVISGILEEEAKILLKEFFKNLRQIKNITFDKTNKI